MSAESRERKRNKEQELAGPKRKVARAREAGGNEEGRVKADEGRLHVDGMKYWTMGSPISETTVLNRAKS